MYPCIYTVLYLALQLFMMEISLIPFNLYKVKLIFSQTVG